MSSPLASLTFMNAIIFGVHGHVVRTMEDQTSIWTHFVAGCAAGSAQGILAAPTELLKLRIQIQTDDAHAKYKSPYHCFQTIIKEEGISKLGRFVVIKYEIVIFDPSTKNKIFLDSTFPNCFFQGNACNSTKRLPRFWSLFRFL